MMTSDGLNVLKSICVSIENNKQITKMDEIALKAAFGDSLINKVIDLFQSGEFFHINCKDSDKVELYAVIEVTKKEYYFKPTSTWCNCYTAYKLSLMEGVPVICHHLIAVEIAKRLNYCQDKYLSLVIIRQCILKKADSMEDGSDESEDDENW